MFCIIVGLAIYVAFLILTVLIAFLVRGLKVGRFLKSRKFLLGVACGILVFPCLLVLIWWMYSFCSFHSTVNKLKTCDSIEITIYPSAFEACPMLYSYVDSKSLVDDSLFEHPTKLVITNKNIIRSIAHEILKTTYRIGEPGTQAIFMSWTDIFICKNGKVIDGFGILGGNNLVTGRYGTFFSSERLLDKIFRILPQTRPITMRAFCASNLYQLGRSLQFYDDSHNRKYPDPNNWCDILLAESVKYFYDGAAAISVKDFVCQAAGPGKCHYAINPYCTPQSPNDVVLLFETHAGWNQHGGPELMAFDHHEPNGCNVLLNRGKIKFITPDHVADLKWKPREE